MRSSNFIKNDSAIWEILMSGTTDNALTIHIYPTFSGGIKSIYIIIELHQNLFLYKLHLNYMITTEI